jgi:hypothetical protein
MPRYSILMFCAAAIVACAGCATNYRELDESQARRQFHVPDEVALDTLISPQTSGWFGREGLHIRAVFHFTERQFREYVAALHSRSVWEPVSFKHYTPSEADAYAEDAFRWTPLPLAAFPRPLAHLAAEFDTAIVNGFWYCSLIVTDLGNTGTHSSGTPSTWTTRGIHGLSLPDNESPIITTFGILDADRRMLFVSIGFSG